MKLKPRHFEIAKTISYFVDRNYYPEFKEPTRDQIDLFTQIESTGDGHLDDDQLKLVEPLRNGKTLYDLQITMIHQELKEWVIKGWGWYGPMDSIFRNVWPERHERKTYIKFLIKLIRNLKDNGSHPTLVSFSGFNEIEKKELIDSISKNCNGRSND